jgi:predicted membrane protein
MHSSINGRLFFGIVLLALGVLLLLDNFDILESGPVLRWWPVVLIAFGLMRMVQPGGGKIFGILLVIVGAALLLNNLDITSIRFWDLWPLFLVLLGVSMLWRRSLVSAPRGASSPDNTLYGSAFMGGFERSSASQAFEGGRLSATMGGCEVDLRNAKMKGEEVVIDVFVFWGGIELKVPREWNVQLDVSPFMGGAEDETVHPSVAGAPRLRIRGEIIMGGLTVGN